MFRAYGASPMDVTTVDTQQTWSLSTFSKGESRKRPNFAKTRENYVAVTQLAFVVVDNVVYVIYWTPNQKTTHWQHGGRDSCVR